MKRGRVYATTRSSADGRVCRNRVKEKQLIWGWGQKVVEGETVERQAVGLLGEQVSGIKRESGRALGK